jgi:hypothetical protein
MTMDFATTIINFINLTTTTAQTVQNDATIIDIDDIDGGVDI